jgi:hypothetical protein
MIVKKLILIYLVPYETSKFFTVSMRACSVEVIPRRLSKSKVCVIYCSMLGFYGDQFSTSASTA